MLFWISKKLILPTLRRHVHPFPLKISRIPGQYETNTIVLQSLSVMDSTWRCPGQGFDPARCQERLCLALQTLTSTSTYPALECRQRLQQQDQTYWALNQLRPCKVSSLCNQCSRNAIWINPSFVFILFSLSLTNGYCLLRRNAVWTKWHKQCCGWRRNKE